MTDRDNGHRTRFCAALTAVLVAVAAVIALPVQGDAAPAATAVQICGVEAAQGYVNGLADELGVMRPTVRSQLDADRRAVYRVSASRILVPQREVLPCVTDSIMAHEFGHYVVDVASRYDPLTFLKLSKPFAAYRNWLSARDASGVERAAHCIGYRFVPEGVYTRCPDEDARKAAEDLVALAVVNRLPMPVLLRPETSGWCVFLTCGAYGWAVRWERPPGNTIESLVLQRNGEEIARIGPLEPTVYIDSAADVRGGDVYTLVSTNSIGSSSISAQPAAASPFTIPPVPREPRATLVGPRVVSLAWDPPANAGTSMMRWQVFHNGFSVAVVTEPKYRVDALVPGTEHRFRVAACAMFGCSAASVELVATTPR